MPDRSLRLLTLPPYTARGETRGALLLRERPSSPPDTPSGPPQGGDGQDDNPFAPPPEGTPDRPWQPRPAAGGHGRSGGQRGHGEPGGEDGSGGSQGDHGGRKGNPWGPGWSDRQPGSQPGGFGDRPGSRPEGPSGDGPGPGPGPGMRWDPTDPVQRRARYALIGGMWAFMLALFGWSYVSLLLGALALYWGISALRGKPRTDPGRQSAGAGARPQTTAAVSGLVTASLALALVGAGFTAQLVYRDYYTCTKDALTDEAKQSCTDLLPKELRGLLGTAE
ncbi:MULTISPECIES: hypothetical protein [unclassified Streptomyces]|uniref:hypothetical protein n=1 Tax=unclassified Streptomyces TaxID=2593676 RepID=UPI001F04B026|nr:MULTISPECIES: hypothetical protein [unclassified Streptomyces]MCH0563951.1 hypothetical protein [Streptomyces sp. MUM 2J]MCH0570718.1 hypothetical protein [Streptomyces sp. MUM 136J]